MPGHRLPASRVAGQRGGAGAHDQRQRLRGAREDTVADRGLMLGRLMQAGADAGDGRPLTWRVCHAVTGLLGADGGSITVGGPAMNQGFELVLQSCGIAARPGLVAELARHDRDMLCASPQLYADTIPFLRSLRSPWSGGIRIALVSRCAENTPAASVRPRCQRDGRGGVFRVRLAAPSLTTGFTSMPSACSACPGAAVFVDDQPLSARRAAPHSRP